ncbi:MAG: type II secretion system protein [Planctomycetota bacterium]
MLRRTTTHAFTLVEVILTILIVSVGLVASMRALPILLQVSEASAQGMTAHRLAMDLLSEIALLPYDDPDGNVKFGREYDETSVTRADFDDIDDYDEWKASPPQKKNGQPEPGCTGYTRSVLVRSVRIDNFNDFEGDDNTKPKRITVTVSRPGMTPVVITTVRLKDSNREDLD